MEQVEVVVIGAGVVGLAVARQLALQGQEVLIIEAEKHIGSVTSSRNSGVIHGGLHYRTGSLKARHCVKGREALYRYAKEQQISHRKCGKIIVAVNNTQVPKLHEIKSRAEVNGVHDLCFLSADELRAYESEVVAVAGLQSPSTGIIDVHELMHRFLGDAEARGAMLTLNSPVAGVAIEDDRFVINVAGTNPIKLSCRYLVNAAGLAAQKIARQMVGLNPATIPQQTLAKGNYFSLSGKQPFQTLIYPVPEPGGLGIHATLDMAGKVKFGPDVEWISTIDYTVDPRSAARFYESVRRYWPGIKEGSLQPAYAGIRSKISARGATDADFMIQGEKNHHVPRLVNLYGIESPGLTSSLSLGDHVSQLLLPTVDP